MAAVEPMGRPCTPPVHIFPSRSPPDQDIQFLESVEPLDLSMNPQPSFCYRILQIPQSVLKPAEEPVTQRFDSARGEEASLRPRGSWVRSRPLV